MKTIFLDSPLTYLQVMMSGLAALQAHGFALGTLATGSAGIG
ncbi:hypothetical protein ACIP5Y_23540 [Nocardia sp. NPDC088792]